MRRRKHLADWKTPALGGGDGDRVVPAVLDGASGG
jgi:hypothetical protein